MGELFICDGGDQGEETINLFLVATVCLDEGVELEGEGGFLSGGKTFFEVFNGRFDGLGASDGVFEDLTENSVIDVGRNAAGEIVDDFEFTV